MIKTLPLKTQQHAEMIDITREIQQAITESGLKKGFIQVWVPHTTAAVTINENADPDVRNDLLKGLESLVEKLKTEFQHAEGNSDAHFKAAVIGCSVILPVEGGKLSLGTWQGVFFCEFDGPRERRYILRSGVEDYVYQRFPKEEEL